MEKILIYLLTASKIIAPLTDIYCLILILRFIKNYKAYKPYKAYQYFMIGLICLFLLATTSIRTFKDIIFIKSNTEKELERQKNNYLLTTKN